MGETAVDFCFGCAVEDEEGEAVWPVFVLWADGEIFYVTGDEVK